MTLEHLALSRAAADRAAHHRTDEAWLDKAWADDATRVLAVSKGRVLVENVSDGPSETVRLHLVAPAKAPAGERMFLGEHAGTAYFAVRAERLVAPLGDPGDLVEAGLREVGTLLDDLETGLLVDAVALANWHDTHTHCPRCGAPTASTAGGHVRRCPDDGSEHYPRTDPAVIMTVVDADDRLLLGHQAVWPANRFSTLAGFVEPGESLEQAVAREVLEESGVVVAAAEYLGSQPWPFPASLMLGFCARASTTEVVTDDEEISEARWFSREQLADAVRTGDVLLPPAVSIARRLIEHWFGGPLDDRGAAPWR
ncbi:MAG: NAD(+) diphosphatase [Motilibacteraceae bacterium]